MTANHRRVRAAGNPGPLAAHLTAATEPEEDRDRALEAMGETRARGEHKGAVPLPRRDMAPQIAAALGIDRDRSLTLKEYEHLLAGKRADGTDQPRRRAETGPTRAVDGVEVVLSPHNSVSNARELAATDAGRAAIDLCVERAADDAMRFLEREAAFTRRGAGGTRSEGGEIAWVRVHHRTARGVSGSGHGADPDTHLHHFVPNLVATSSGHTGTLDSRRLRGFLKVQGGYFQARLATHLREAGVRVVADPKTRTTRIADIPDTVVAAFAKRTAAAEANARAYAKTRESEWGTTWDELPAKARGKLIKAGALRTQASGRDGMADRWGWRAQAASLGFSPKDVADPSRPTSRQFTPESRRARAWAVAQPMLRDALFERPVLAASEVRAIMARAHVATGISAPDDIDRSTELLRTHGLRLEKGEPRVALVWMRDPARQGAILVTTLEHAKREARGHIEVPAPGAPREREPMAALLRRAEAIRVGTVRLAVETKLATTDKPVGALGRKMGMAGLRDAVRALAPPPSRFQRQMTGYRAAQVRYGLALVSYGVKRLVARATFRATRRSLSVRMAVGAAILAFKAARLAVRAGALAVKGGVEVGAMAARSQAVRSGLRAVAEGISSLPPTAAASMRRALDRAAAVRAVHVPPPAPPTLAERAAGIRADLSRTMKEMSRMASEVRPGALWHKMETVAAGGQSAALAAAMARLRRPEVRMRLEGETQIRLYARALATRPEMSFRDAVGQVVGAMIGERNSSLPRDPVHRLAISDGIAAWARDAGRVTRWAELRLEKAASAYQDGGEKAMRAALDRRPAKPIAVAAPPPRTAGGAWDRRAEQGSAALAARPRDPDAAAKRSPAIR